MSEPPSPEELQRLLAIHHRPRGPIAVDGAALSRVKRWVAQERPGFRFVIRPGQVAEVTAEELHGAIRQLVEDGRIIRQRGRRLALEAEAEPLEQLQQLFRQVSGLAWQVLDGRRCARCKSYLLQIAYIKIKPGWAVHCRNCGKSQRVAL